MGSTHHHLENRGFQVSETEIISLLSKNKGKVTVQVVAKSSGKRDSIICRMVLCPVKLILTLCGLYKHEC